MKKVLILSLLLMLIPISSAFAATVIVDNYFYAHTNQAGTTYFKDKYGTQAMYGDNIQHDATIDAVTVVAQGLAAGDKITLTTSAGQSYDITPNQQVTVSVGKTQSMRLAIVKTGTNEVYARLDRMVTTDDSDGGTTVAYSFSVNDIPTSYGDLGPGSGGGGTTVPGNYTYFQPTDAYQYYYTAPTGTTSYILRFYNASGAEIASKTYNKTPSGLHYLTCNGTYKMEFYSGTQLIGSSPMMQTTQIQNAVCSSYGDDEAGGINDINLRYTKDADGKRYIEWDPVPGAGWYDVYRNGVYIHGGASYVTKEDVPDDGSTYTVIARTSQGSGDNLGQGDVVTPPAGTDPTDPATGCDGCQQIKDMLACPEWDQYMGEWGKVIRENVPPAPDWDMVAGKMRDAIVPAMGQELVNRAPEIAEIIADEFQSREKPVSPPPTAPTFDPSAQLPHLQDIPSPVPFDASTNNPDFTPDFSQSEPFTIPDPANITYSDTDKGYDYADPNEPLPSHSYTTKTPEPGPAPTYTTTEPSNEPAPTYHAPAGSAEPAPTYEMPAGGTPPVYNGGTTSGADTHEYYSPSIDTGG